MERLPSSLFAALLALAAMPGCSNSDFASSASDTKNVPHRSVSSASTSDEGTGPDETAAADVVLAPTDHGTGVDDGSAGTDDDMPADGGGTSPPANGSGTGGKNDGKPEEAQIAKIPGLPVIRAGVNFEDSRAGDADYNDAVLCFEGNFKVDGALVTSTSKQKVIASTYSHAGCNHTVKVVIVSAPQD